MRLVSIIYTRSRISLTVCNDSHLAWICDKCQKAKFRTFEEAEEHEETCDGTYDPESADANALVDTKVAAKKDKESDNEEWWKAFKEKADKTDLNMNDIGHGGKIVLLLQIIGE